MNLSKILDFTYTYWQYLLLETILGISSYLFIYNATTTITVTIESESNGVMILYYPDTSGAYSQHNLKGANYPIGCSTQTFTFSEYSTKYPLRLDPFSGTRDIHTGESIYQRLSIKKFSVSKLGQKAEIDGNKLQNFIVDRREIDLDYLDGMLRLKSNSEDPQINFTSPSNLLSVAIYSITLLLYVAGSIILIGMHWIIRNKSTIRNWKSYIFILIIVPLFGGILFSQHYTQFMFIIVLLLTLLDVFISTFMEIVNKNFRIQELLNSSTAILFILSITLPLILTYIFTPLGGEVEQFYCISNDNDSKNSFFTRMRFISSNIEDSFLQHFKFRSDLLNINSILKLTLFQDSPLDKLILGQQGVWFEGAGQRKVEEGDIGYLDCISDYLGLVPFSDAELEKWRITLEERYFWLKEQGIAFVFVMAPNKSQIYPEYLPKKVNAVASNSGNRRYDQLINYLQKNSFIPVVDLRKYLLEIKEKVRTGCIPNYSLYYRTDGHYNGYGAFFAYKAISAKINEFYPNFHIGPADINDFTIHSSDMVVRRFQKALALENSDLLHDTFLTLYPKNGSIHARNLNFIKNGINIDQIYEENPHSDNISMQLVHESAEIPTLLIVGDSFGQKIANYFSVHANRCIFYRSVTKFNPSKIEKLRPQIYIQEILNMYLQYKIPENPRAIKSARVMALQYLHKQKM